MTTYRKIRGLAAGGLLAPGLLLAGCAGQGHIAIQPLPLDEDETVTQDGGSGRGMAPRIDILFDAPPEPVIGEPLSDADVASLVPEQSVAATLPPQPLGQFVETALGQVLGVPYIAGPGIAQRRDLISMSGPREMSSRQFLRLVEQALNQYGLELRHRTGALVVREATSARPGNGATRHVAALQAISAAPVAEIVADLMGGEGGLAVEAREASNSLAFSGDGNAIDQARQIAETIDRPEFVGMRVARISPVLWNADALAASLREVLANEGFAIGASGAGGTSLVHLEAPDCLLLFSDDARLFNRVLYWANQLDSLDGAGGDKRGYFVYQVRNTTAAELGSLISRARSSDDDSGGSSPLSGNPLSRSDGAPGGLREDTLSSRGPEDAEGSGQVVVDNAGNRILFRGTRKEYAQILRLLRELDVTPRQVLVEITIAEVTLTDETRFGMEWFLDRQISNGSIQATTTGGLERESGGLGITFARGFARTSVEAALNAVATNQNLNILSTPRLLARSGGQARILIGNDVPIITSQRAAEIQSNGDTDILQTVQYRQTGVILNIKPVVLNDERIDIEIFQEVSSQQPNVTSSIGSPVISNRSVATRLSLREGMTAVLGGMMQDSQTMGQRGVPLMKDIPLLGRAFRVDSAAKRKTELLILVTPKVIREDRAMAGIAANFSASLNGLMANRGQKAITLLPWVPGQKPPRHQHYQPAPQP
jgi:general secretion pathway protein D